MRRALLLTFAICLVGAPAADAEAQARAPSKRAAAHKKKPARHKPTKAPPKAQTELPADAPPPWLRPVTVRTIPSVRPAIATPLAPASPTERTLTGELRTGDAGSTRTIKMTARPREEGSRAILTLAQGDRVLQTLTLDLDVAPALALATVEVIDLDLDGYKDVRVLREHGAKWGRYAVLLFDAKSGKLTEGALSAKLAELPNLEVDAARRQIVSTTLGPDAPSRTAYEIVRGELTLSEACVFHMRAAGRGTLTVRQRGLDKAVRTRRYDDVAVPPAFPKSCALSPR